MYNINENLNNLRRDVHSFLFKLPKPIADEQLITRISTLENRITKYEWINCFYSSVDAFTDIVIR